MIHEYTVKVPYSAEEAARYRMNIVRARMSLEERIAKSIPGVKFEETGILGKIRIKYTGEDSPSLGRTFKGRKPIISEEKGGGSDEAASQLR